MLSQEQKKWIENNYDLIREVVGNYAETSEESEEIESYASWFICECFNEGVDTAEDLRVLVAALLRVVIPKMISQWRNEHWNEFYVGMWDEFEKMQNIKHNEYWCDSKDREWWDITDEE